MKKVSIIIRSKNEEKWIVHCLKAIYNQNHKNFEIILVDNNSEDLTISRAKKYVHKIIKIKNFKPGKAINEGIKRSTGEIIVILSAHCIPTNSSWLKNLIHDLKDPTIAGVYGKQEPMIHTDALDKRDLYTVFGKDKKIQINDHFFHNANSALLRKTWKKFPFDEKVTNIEDRVWAKNIINKKLKIVYEPKASVFHFHGINQELNIARANQVVKVLEKIEKVDNKNNFINPDNLKIVAIIPIKGQSIKFKNKNLLSLTLNVAKKSKYISEIIVSTDNLKTKKLAKKYGAKVPFLRTSKLSEKNISISDVVRYSLKKIEDKKKYYDLVVILHETYPFRPFNLIDKMILKLLESGKDTIIAVRKERKTIWLQNDKQINVLNDIDKPRDLKKDNFLISLFGLCTITHPQSIRLNQIYSKNLLLYEIDDPMSSIDLNSFNNSLKLLKYFK